MLPCIPFIDSGWIILLLTQLSIYSKLVIYQTSPNSLHPMKTNILSLTGYFNIFGLTSNSVGSYKHFDKIVHFESFPSLIQTPFLFLKTTIDVPPMVKIQDPKSDHSLHSLTSLSQPRFARVSRGVGSRRRGRGWCLPASRARLSRFARSPRIKQKKRTQKCQKSYQKEHPAPQKPHVLHEKLKIVIPMAILKTKIEKKSQPPISPNV